MIVVNGINVAIEQQKGWLIAWNLIKRLLEKTQKTL